MTTSKIFYDPIPDWDRINDTNHTIQEILDLLEKRWDEVSPSELRECRAIGFHPRRRDPIVKVQEFPVKLGSWDVSIFQRSKEGVHYQVYGGRVIVYSVEP